MNFSELPLICKFGDSKLNRVKMKLNKLTIQLIVLIAVISSSVLTSCNKSQYHKLSEDEENTWGIYKENKTFNFISTQGDLIEYKTGGRYKAYNKSGNVYDEYLYTKVYQIDDTTSATLIGDRGLYIDKTSSGLSVRVGLPHFYDNVNVYGKPTITLHVNGKSYPDVYTVVASPAKLDSINYIDTIYYSQSAGFLQYIDMYGETYTVTQ